MMYGEYSTDAFERKYTYAGDDLGACWSPEKTRFRLWAPTAEHCEIRLYRSGTQGQMDCVQQVPMSPAENGTWIAAVSGNLN